MAKPTTKAAASPPGRKGGRRAVRLPDASAIEPAQIPTPDGQRRRGDDVRERILAAATQCFCAFGFEGTSTRAIAAKAGITHSLVIYHFESKDQLWLSTMELIIGSFIAELQSAFKENEGPADEALRKFIAKFVRLSSQHPEVNRIMTMEGGQDTDRLRHVMNAHGRKVFNEFCSLIRRGQEEGTVKDCDPARMYFHIVASGESTFSKAPQYKELTGRDAFSEQEILRTIAFLYDIVLKTAENTSSGAA